MEVAVEESPVAERAGRMGQSGSTWLAELLWLLQGVGTSFDNLSPGQLPIALGNAQVQETEASRKSSASLVV